MKKALKISKYIPSSSQAKLNLFVTERRVSLATEHTIEPLVRQGLFGLLALFFVLYLYFVSASDLNIMARREASSASLALQSAVAQMQGEYFAMTERVDEGLAHDIGLSPVAETSYVYRPGNTAAAAPQMADRMGDNAI